MNQNPATKQFILILRICCFMLFVGRGWQYYFWDAPFRTLLWNEGFMQGIVETFMGVSWHEYATDLSMDGKIKWLVNLNAIFFFFMGIFSLWVKPIHKRLGKLLLLGSVSILFLVLLYFYSKYFAIGMLIEHGIQITVPTFLWLALFRTETLEKYFVYFKLAIAFTFVGHGMFAFGIHPVPGPFIDMVINITGASEDLVRIFLKIAGSIDFIVGVTIFIPALQLYALTFNIFWGIATAFARILAHVDPDQMSFTSMQWACETLYRIPHGLFPLGLYLLIVKSKNPAESIKPSAKTEVLSN